MIEPVVLEGTIVRLEPLAMRHVPALAEAANDSALWEWTSDAPLLTPERTRLWVERALAYHEDGSALPFATIHKETGVVVGSTRFGNIATAHKRAEIGWTWIAQKWQRTAVNTEAKYLMLRHAFETWDYNRVEIKTDVRNAKSRAAIERLGATYEGTLRQHTVCESGRVRDTVYYSIVRDEWPTIKAMLEAKLAARG